MSYMTWFTLIVAGSYFIALFSVTSPLHRPNGLQTDPQPNPIGFVLPAAAFGIFSGLRINIGDTDSYVYSYRLGIENSDPNAAAPVFRFSGNEGFNYLQSRLGMITDEPYALIMITALMAVVPIIYILFRYSAPYELGIALFVLTGYYTFSMNGIRQYAAAGLLILGTRYLFSDKKSDFLKYLPFVFMAWLFHSSALVMIPIYFLVRRRSWTPFTMLLLVGTIFVTLIFDSILPSFLGFLENTDYSIYAENGWFTNGEEQGSDIIRIFVLTVPLVLAYMWRFDLNAVLGRKWDIMVNMSVLNLAFYILSLYNWIFARFAIYTSVYVIIMMTHLLSKGAREQFRLLYFSMIGLYIYFFYNIRYSITAYQSELF